jgi:hypothetical protein
MCHLPVRCCTDPSGAAYSNVLVFISNKDPGVGSRVYIPTCLPVARDEDEGSLLLCFMLCTRKVEDLYNWIFVVILMLLQWLLYFVLWCYLLIQGMAQIHRSSAFR